MTAAPTGVGRPRHAAPLRPGATGREQILDGAAQMFTELGYAATSTRVIAEAVGIKQASLYYHFPSKEDILCGLLEDTVQPTLDVADRLAGTGAAAHVQLWALIHEDVTLLLTSRWNIGALYLLPELRTERFSEFRDKREQLKDAYTARIADGIAAGTFAAEDPVVASSLGFALSESVISMRSDGCDIDPALPEVIATSALRLLGCSAKAIAAARSADL